MSQSGASRDYLNWDNLRLNPERIRKLYGSASEGLDETLQSGIPAQQFLKQRCRSWVSVFLVVLVNGEAGCQQWADDDDDDDEKNEAAPGWKNASDKKTQSIELLQIANASTRP